jgi:hypothetical protein
MTDVDDRTDPTAEEPVPLGFKIVLYAAAAYLILRVVQMIGWLF